jgi:hypothetical protein
MKRFLAQCLAVLIVWRLAGSSSPRLGLAKAPPGAACPELFRSETLAQAAVGMLNSLHRLIKVAITTICLVVLALGQGTAPSGERSGQTISADELTKPLSDQEIDGSLQSLGKLISEYEKARRVLVFNHRDLLVDITDVSVLQSTMEELRNPEDKEIISKYLRVREALINAFKDLEYCGGFAEADIKSRFPDAPTFLLRKEEWKRPALRKPPPAAPADKKVKSSGPMDLPLTISSPKATSAA